MPNDQYIQPLMTVREVSELLGVHINTVRRWSNDGRLRSYRISQRGDFRFRKEDIVPLLAEVNHG